MNSRIKIISFVLTLISFFIPNQSPAQAFTQTLRGIVLDTDTREPLEGVQIALFSGDKALRGTFSDEEGAFRFDSVETGRYNLRFLLVTFQDKWMRDVIVNSGKQVILNVELVQSVTGPTVEILGDKKTDTRNDMITVSGRQFTIDETMRYAGSWNDPARMASNFAGVGSQDDSRNDIIIRGNSPSGVLWRLEGIDIPNPNHFGAFGTTGGPVTILNNNVLDNSDFMTSAWPAEYGNALSGVFDLRMRKGNDEKMEGLIQFGFNGLEALAEGPISKKNHSSFLVSYRYSTLELFRLMGINFGTSGRPQYQDLSFKVYMPAGKAGVFSLFGLGGISSVSILQKERDSTDFFGPSGNDIIYGTNMGAVGISHFIPIGKKSWTKTVFSVSGSELSTLVDHIDKDTQEPIPFYRNSSAQSKLNLSCQFNHKFDVRNTVRIGFFIDNLYTNLQDSFQVDTSVGFITLTSFKGGSFLLRPYVQHKFRITDRLSLNSGVYFQYFTLNSTSSIEPRVGLKWDINPKHSLGIGVGKHSQLQPLFVYFAQSQLPDLTYSSPNQNLQMTQSLQSAMTYDFQVSKTLRLKAEAYYQHLYNVPVDKGDSGAYSLINQGAEYYFILPDTLVNTGTGRNYGIELTVEKFFSKNYYFLFTGTYFQSKYTGNDGIERNTQFNGKFVGHFLFGGQYRIGSKKRWVIGADGRLGYAGGKYYTPLDEAATLTYQKPVYNDSLAYALRFPDYFRADIRFKVRLNSKKISQEWAFDITNITNRQNVLNQVYDSPTNTLKFNYQLGLFPVVQYRVEF